MRLRLFLHVLGVEARKRMAYRMDFWINAFVGFVAQFAIVWFLWKALFAESGRDVIAGYGFDEVVVYYVAALLLGRLVRGNEFEAQASEDIYEGSLNRYLVLPAPYVGFKYAQHVGSLLPAVLQLVLFGSLWVALTGGAGGEDITWAGAAMALAATMLGNLLYYAMSFSLHAIAFWADNVWSLLVALRMGTALLGGLMFPMALFPGWFQAASAWLPFRNLFALPAETLVGRSDPATWGQGMLVGLAWLGVLALLGRVVWRRGCLQYSGIGI